MSLPSRVRSGDLLAWAIQTQLAGVEIFYVLTGVINNVPTRVQIPQVAVDANGVATFSAASSVTAEWLPGRYQWVCFSVDANGNRDELAQGKIIVQPDPAGTNPADPRTQNEILLANIKALQQGKSLDDVTMYKIGERELTKMSISDLLSLGRRDRGAGAARASRPWREGS